MCSHNYKLKAKNWHFILLFNMFGVLSVFHKGFRLAVWGSSEKNSDLLSLAIIPVSYIVYAEIKRWLTEK